MSISLQIWGGSCYLLNKILLSIGEGRADSTTLKIWGWALYLIGLPAWVIILVSERSWIAATIEAGGAPSMVLGLLLAVRGKEAGRPPKALDRFSMIFAYVLLTVGVPYSLLTTAASRVCRRGWRSASPWAFWAGPISSLKAIRWAGCSSCS